MKKYLLFASILVVFSVIFINMEFKQFNLKDSKKSEIVSEFQSTPDLLKTEKSVIVGSGERQVQISQKDGVNSWAYFFPNGFILPPFTIKSIYSDLNDIVLHTIGDHGSVRFRKLGATFALFGHSKTSLTDETATTIFDINVSSG